jgi:hypothetical protein
VHPRQEFIVRTSRTRLEHIAQNSRWIDHAIAGFELTNGGDRAIPIDRPPPR